jgi:uncharacterized protein (DUF1697 family)
MQTFIVLMRGINVGATRKLPMAALRALCPELGLERPETYIQSGNLIVDADGGGERVRDLLERELTGRFGFTVDIVLRAAADWGHFVRTNPFAGDAESLAKAVHLYLSRDPPNAAAAQQLERRARTGERIASAGGALWIDYGGEGVAGSALTPVFIDKACGSPTTGRNWNTVLKIRDMIAARGARAPGGPGAAH